MINDVLVIEANPKTWEEAIETSYKALYDAGYVKKSFLEGCIEREKKYPTGLMTRIPIAVPHTDLIHVIKPAISFMRLKEPVMFHNMEDPENGVYAEYVFNMALNTCDDQIDLLKAIIGTAQDEVFLERAKNEPLSDIRNELIKKWRVL